MARTGPSMTASGEGQNQEKEIKIMNKQTSKKKGTCIPAAIAVMALTIGLAASAIAQSAITEVIGGLHSPRGLAFGPGGHLYVAQTGDDTISGSIIEILNPMSKHPNVRTIVSDLAVTGDPEEGEFLGVSGLSVFGQGKNFGLYAIMAVDPEQTG